MATELDDVVRFLADSRAVADKLDIHAAYAPALDTVGDDTRIGDDCAAIPDGSGGSLLFAAEGLLQRFVVDDPWFAGYSAVMVNLSDVAAMGGRSLAIVDVIWTPDMNESSAVWDGMKEAADAYRIPIVGGHTISGSRIEAREQPACLPQDGGREIDRARLAREGTFSRAAAAQFAFGARMDGDRDVISKRRLRTIPTA